MGSQAEQTNDSKPDIASEFDSWLQKKSWQLTRPDLGFTPMVKVAGEWEVDKVVDALPGDAPKTGGQSPLAFFHMIERLKTTKREGWRRFGIER